jgi:hypothetical protein
MNEAGLSQADKKLNIRLFIIQRERLNFESTNLVLYKDKRITLVKMVNIKLKE